MNKKWSDEETRWLKINFGRMDLQNLSHKLGCSLTEIEKKVKQLRLVAPEQASARKTPGTLKEAVREISAARRDYEKAIDLFHKRKLEEAGRHFEDLIEKHPDEKEFVDRARMYLSACRNGKKGRAALPNEPEELSCASPDAFVRMSRPETALVSSVSSVTCATLLATFVTSPTSPSAVTTASCLEMPSFFPAETTICCSNWLGARAITRADTAR